MATNPDLLEEQPGIHIELSLLYNGWWTTNLLLAAHVAQSGQGAKVYHNQMNNYNLYFKIC